MGMLLKSNFVNSQQNIAIPVMSLDLKQNKDDKTFCQLEGVSTQKGINLSGLFYSNENSHILENKDKTFNSLNTSEKVNAIDLSYEDLNVDLAFDILQSNGYYSSNEIAPVNLRDDKAELEAIFFIIQKSFGERDEFEEVLNNINKNKNHKNLNNYLTAISSIYNSYINEFEDSLKNLSKEDRALWVINNTNFEKDINVLSKTLLLSNVNSKTNIENKVRNPIEIQLDGAQSIIKEFDKILSLEKQFLDNALVYEKESEGRYMQKGFFGGKLNTKGSIDKCKKEVYQTSMKLEESKQTLKELSSYQNKILDGTISDVEFDEFKLKTSQLMDSLQNVSTGIVGSVAKVNYDFDQIYRNTSYKKTFTKPIFKDFDKYSKLKNAPQTVREFNNFKRDYQGGIARLSNKDIVKNQQKVDENQIENVEKIPEVEKSLRDLLNGSNVENMDAQDRSKYLNYINTTLDEYANFFYKVNTNSGTKAFTRNIDPFLQQELNNYLNSRETHALNRIEYMTKDEILDGFNQVLSRAKQIEQTPYKVEFADAILNNSNLDNEYRGLVCFEKYVNSRNNSGFDNTLKDYFETQVQKNELNLLYLKLDELERQNNDNKYNELREQLVELSNTGVPISPHNFFIACDKLNIDIAPSKEYIAKMRAYATLQSIAIVDNSDSFFVYGKNEASVDEKIMTLNEIFSSEDPEKAIESKLLDNIKEWQTAMDKEPSFKNLAEALEQANENMEIDIPYGEDRLNFGQFYEEIIRSEATKTYFDKILQESMNSPFLMNNLFIDKVPLEKRKELYVELEKNHIVRRLVSEGAIDGVIEINENTRDNLKDVLSIRKALSDRINNDALDDIEKTNMYRLINIIDNTCLDTMFYSNEIQYKNSNIEILTRDKVLELKKQISTIQANSEKELETISNIKFSNKDTRGLIFIKGEMENNSIKDFNEEFVNSLSEDNLETISFILNLEGDEISKEDIQNALGDKNLLEIRKTDGTFIISSLGNKNENEISALAKEYISKAADKCPKELYKQVDIQEENSLIVSEYKNLVNKAFAKDIQRNINGYGMEINNLVKNEEELTKIVLDRLSKDENKDIKALLDNKFKGIENSPVSYWSKNVFSRENIEKMDLSNNELDSIEKLKAIIEDTSDKYATTHEYKDDVRDYDSIKEDLTKLIVAHKDSTNFELLLGSLITPNGLQKISGVDESLAKDWIDFCQKHGNENAISLYNACKQIFEENKIHIKQIVEVTTEETPQPILNETNENNPINLEDSSSDKNEVENSKPSKEDVAKNLTILNENASKEISIDNGKSISNETNIANTENELSTKEDIVTKDSNNINVSEILDEVIDNINKQNETMCKNLSNIATQNMDWETVEKIIKVRKDNENFMNKVGRFREKIEQQIADSVNISDFNDISKEKLVKEIESKLNYIYTSNNKSISDISISIKNENEKEVGTIKWDMISKEIEDNKEISKETEKENDNEIEKTSKNGLDLND